ncbi:hypothetical protein [Acidovorax soli]|uniref:hypothetical protein n=1 Tax=Acidovorax soli TaxID=592050 RepID=UPI0032B12E86
MFIYVVMFSITGALMVLILNADESSQAWIALLVRNHSIVYAWHLVCWMILGMFTNYYWDLFNMGKGIESMQPLRIVLPLLVSPFVFMPTYNLWLASSSQSYMLFAVIAIQSGFFWQALLAKVAPLDKAASIPWSVNNGAGRANRAAATSKGPELS